jgi:hypothetical protein
MPENFRRSSSTVVSVQPSGQIVYTVPSNATSIVLSIYSTYTGLSSLGYFTASASGRLGQTFLVKNAQIQAGGSTELVANKLVLASGDSVIIGASASGVIDVNVSYLEIT